MYPCVQVRECMYAYVCACVHINRKEIMYTSGFLFPFRSGIGDVIEVKESRQLYKSQRTDFGHVYFTKVTNEGHSKGVILGFKQLLTENIV